MARIECEICKEEYALDRFRFLPCGHGFCMDCLVKSRSIPTCPLCRRPKGNEQPRQIFVTLANEQVEEKAQPVELKDGLDLINADASSSTIRRAGRKLKKAIKGANIDQATADALMTTTLNLEERLLPVFVKLEEERAEKRELLRQIKDMHDKAREADFLDNKVTCLQVELHEARQHYEEIFALAAEARAQVEDAKERYQQARYTTEKVKKMLRRKEEDIAQLHASIESRDRQIALLNRKLKALSKQAKRQAGMSSRDVPEADIDESLIVEGPFPVENLPPEAIVDQRPKRRKVGEV